MGSLHKVQLMIAELWKPSAFAEVFVNSCDDNIVLSEGGQRVQGVPAVKKWWDAFVSGRGRRAEVRFLDGIESTDATKVSFRLIASGVENMGIADTFADGQPYELHALLLVKLDPSTLLMKEMFFECSRGLFEETQDAKLKAHRAKTGKYGEKATFVGDEKGGIPKDKRRPDFVRR